MHIFGTINRWADKKEKYTLTQNTCKIAELFQQLSSHHKLNNLQIQRIEEEHKISAFEVTQRYLFKTAINNCSSSELWCGFLDMSSQQSTACSNNDKNLQLLKYKNVKCQQDINHI